MAAFLSVTLLDHLASDSLSSSENNCLVKTYIPVFYLLQLVF